MATPKRFVSLAAVSTLRQAKKVSLEDQLKTNKEHIERWNGVLVTELVIRGQSRSISELDVACQKIPAYAQLRDLIRRRAFDVLIYLDQTRLGRKPGLIQTITDLCNDAGILLYETREPPATLEPPVRSLDKELIGAIKGVMARDEVEKIKYRMGRGMLKAAQDGRHPNRPPYGYKKVFEIISADKIEKHVVIDESQGRAEAVRVFFDLYLGKGWSLRQIRDEFIARGYPAPRGHTWHEVTLGGFIDRAWAYAGILEYGHKRGRVRATAEWPPLISEETARAAIAERRRRAPQRRAVNSPCRFSGILVCATCGGTLTGNGVNSAGNYRYLCINGCRGSMIVEWRLVEALEAFFDHLSEHAVLESIVASAPQPGDASAKKLARVQGELERIQAERKRLTTAYTRGILKFEEYEEMMQPLASQEQAQSELVEHLKEQAALESSPASFVPRLLTMRDEGKARLAGSDAQAVNQWLRDMRLQIHVGQVPDLKRSRPNRVARIVALP